MKSKKLLLKKFKIIHKKLTIHVNDGKLLIFNVTFYQIFDNETNI